MEWVLPMDINLYTQDELGQTVLLMVAATHYNLGFLIDLLLKDCTEKYANSEDFYWHYCTVLCRPPFSIT